MNKYIFLSSIVALIFSLSCDTDLQEQSRKEKTVHQNGKPLQFEGLSVRHRYKTPDDYIDDTKSKDRPLAGAYGGQVSLADFSMEDIAYATKKVFKNYPFPSKAKNYQTDFAMIKVDFPNMTEKDIIKNESTIEKYYDINLDYEVLQLLKKTKTPITKKEKKTVSSVALKTTQPLVNSFRAALAYDPNCTMKMPGHQGSYSSIKKCIAWKLIRKDYVVIPDTWNRILWSRATVSLVDSKDEVNKWFKGGKDADNKKDAKRHIYLSALLAINYYTISSKMPRIKFAKDAGDATEECGDNYTDASAMDDHNNKIGRDLFSQNGTYNWWGTFTPPTEDDIRQKTIALVDNHGVWVKYSLADAKKTDNKQEMICKRKYNIQNNADKSKPVYLHDPTVTMDSNFICHNTIKTISLKGAYAKDKKWTVSSNLKKVSGTETESSVQIRAKKGYYNVRGSVKVENFEKPHTANAITTAKVNFMIEPNNLSIQTTSHGSPYGYFLDVSVTGGTAPYKFYLNGNLIKTSSNPTETLRVNKNGGLLKVTAKSVCGTTISDTTIIPIISSSGGGSGFPPI